MKANISKDKKTFRSIILYSATNMTILSIPKCMTVGLGTCALGESKIPTCEKKYEALYTKAIQITIQ